MIRLSQQRETKRGGHRLQSPPPAGKRGSGRSGKKGKPQRTAVQKTLHGLFIALTVVCALILILFAVWKLFLVQKPVVEGEHPPTGVGDGITSVDHVPGQTDGNGPVNTDRKSEDFYTILVVGKDTGGGGNTDTLMLVSYDVTNQKLNVMNIPRDTIVNKPWDIKKINSVYAAAGGGDKGIAALKETVADTVGFTPDFYVIVEWAAVGRMAQAVGGVEFDVPLNMYYDDPTQDLHIHISKGLQTLNGDQVMRVLRFRQNNDGTGYASGDIGRIETQQKLLKAIVKKLLTPATLTRLPELVDIFAENVKTDLSIQNILWFGESALRGGLSIDNVNFVTMPGNYAGYFWCRTYRQNESYVFPYIDELIELVNKDFNPYVTDVSKGDLDIVYKRSDGTIAATSGNLKDTKANSSIGSGGGSKSTSSTSSTPTPAVSDAPPAVSGDRPSVSDSPDASRPPESDAPDTSSKPSESDAPEREEPSDTPEPSSKPDQSPDPSPSEEGPPAGIIIM